MYIIGNEKDREEGERRDGGRKIDFSTVQFRVGISSFIRYRVRGTNGIGMSIPLMKSKLTTTAGGCPPATL